MQTSAASLPVTGNTTHTQPENRAFYPALDGLRALAFLMVFGQHYMAIPWGWTGVNVFFVLSGFLITGILFDTRDKPHRARSFYVRRTLRIFPLYYAIFAVLFVSTPYFGWLWTRGWFAWPLYVGNFLRFVSPGTTVFGSALQRSADAQLHSARFPDLALFFGHFWSLCVEEQFYLIWPWVVFWVRSRRVLLWICGITVLVMPFIRVMVQGAAPAWMLHQELLYRMLPFQLDSLLLGGLVALLWRGTDRARLLQIARIVAGICAVAAIVYIARTAHPSQPHWRMNYAYPVWRLTWGLSFVNLFAAAAIVCCLRSGGWLTSVLSLKPLRWLGRISYGAYVFHDIFRLPYLQLTFYAANYSKFLLRNGTTAVPFVAFVCTLIVASLSFRFFETPFLNLKERLTRQS